MFHDVPVKNAKIDAVIEALSVNHIESIIQSLRDDGTKVDIYPNDTKLNKQLSYANKLKIHYVIIFGENEFNNDKIIVKDMFSNSQKEYKFDDFSSKLFNTK